MTNERWETIETFAAIDEDGRNCTVIAQQKIIGVPTQDDPDGELRGMIVYRLSNGPKLRGIENDIFQCVSDGRILNLRQ